MKRFVLLAVVALLAGAGGTSSASTGGLALGTYEEVTTCTVAGCGFDGTFTHTFTVTSYDSTTGAFAGAFDGGVGTVSGTLSGATIAMTWSRSDGYVAELDGTVDASGNMAGSASDNAGNHTTWTASPDVACSVATSAARDLIVTAGTRCSIGSGSVIGHDVVVQPGGTLVDDTATIPNDIRADQPAGIGIGTNGTVGHDIVIDGATGSVAGDNYICNTHVGHDVIVQNTAATSGFWDIGDAPECTRGGLTVGNDLIVRDNAVFVDVSLNGTHPLGDQAGGIGHDLVATGNASQTVAGNVVGNDATCRPIQTPPTPNQVAGVDDGCDGQIPPPTITAPADGSLSNSSTVTVTGRGIPGATVHVLVDGAEVGSTTVGADGGVYFYFTQVDGAHQLIATQEVDGVVSAPSPVRTFAIDTVAPVVICGAADGVWHPDNVSIACTAADTGSGLANPADASFSLSTSVASGDETANASTGSHQVCDLAGNCVTAGPIGGNMVDRKAPAVSCGTADGFWHNTNVTIGCTATDGGSGVTPTAFGLTTNVPPNTSDGNASTNSVAVCDAVGNCVTAGPIGGNMIDRTPPVLVMPANITSSDPVVRYSATATDPDDIAIVLSCLPLSGTTFPVGTTTVHCTAYDRANNVTSGSFTVTVTPPKTPLQRLTDAANAIGNANIKAHVRNLAQVGGNGYCSQLKVIAGELAAIKPQTPTTADALDAVAELQRTAGCPR